jgi:hypothetical protein
MCRLLKLGGLGLLACAACCALPVIAAAVAGFLGLAR